MAEIRRHRRIWLFSREISGRLRWKRLRVERANWRLRRAALWPHMDAPDGLGNSMQCRGRRLRIFSGFAAKSAFVLPRRLDQHLKSCSIPKALNPAVKGERGGPCGRVKSAGILRSVQELQS